jgi:hypothetical protein
MKKCALFLLCLLLASCGPTILGAQFREGSLIANDTGIHPAEVKSGKVSEGNALRTDVRITAGPSLMKGEKTGVRVAQDSSAAKDIVAQAVDVGYFGTRFMSLPGFAPTLPGADIAMGFYSVMDFMKLVADAKERHNTISARILYDKPVLFWHVENGKNIRTPVTLPVSRADADLMKYCSWLVEAKTYKPHILKQKFARTSPGMAVKDIVLETDEIYEILHYPDGIDTLPETSRCSRKAAEQFLAKMVARRLRVAQ